MSVYNSEATLAATMDSVLFQEGVDLEFIVIDDGSSDASRSILRDYAHRDNRIRVFRQKNSGLTSALIRGCAEARGRYIARQDAGGDLSLPGRLARQSAVFDANMDVVLTSCGTRVVGPEGEFLYEIIQRGYELQLGLKQLSLNRIRGPSHHGSTMFRQSAYRAVGGYRAVFRVAQDLDLWLRMVEIGSCIAIPEVFYQASLTPGAISQVRRKEQLKSASTIIRCTETRRAGGDEKIILQKIKKGDGARKILSIQIALQNARFYYFLGGLLRESQPMRSRLYYQRALKYWFLYPKVWFRLWLTGE